MAPDPIAGRRVLFLGTGGALNVERYQSSIVVESGPVRLLLELLAEARRFAPDTDVLVAEDGATRTL